MVHEQATAFTDVAAYVERDFTVDPGSGAARVRGARVTAGFLRVLGATPAMGRDFASSEDVEGAQPVAVVTHAFWQGRLGADPNIIGRAIRIEGRDTVVVAVLGAGFQFRFSQGEPQVYLTSVFTPDVMTREQIRSGAGFLTYLARLKPAVSLEQARADLAAVDARYRQTFGSYADAANYNLYLVPFNDDLVGAVRPALAMLMGAVLLLLLIACANVAHLLLARAAQRRREAAIRLALGASLPILLRQFVIEALLLTSAGCLLGMAIARTAVSLLVTRGPVDVPRLVDAAPDARVIAFAILIAGITTVVFGVLPVLRLRSLKPGESLQDGRPGSLTSRSAGRLQQWLATSETAVTVALLIVAALLVRSLMRLQAVEPGFSAAQVYTAQVTLQQNSYREPYQREAFFTQLLAGVQAHVPTATVGATSYLPMAGGNYGFFFFIDGQPSLGVGRDPAISVRHVSADFFRAMQIPIRRGRAFADSDSAASQPVALINERAARQFFPDLDPIGRHVANSRDKTMREIVGIVGDVHSLGPAQSATAELYLPYRQVPWPSMTVVVASTLRPEEIAGAIRSTVQRLDRDQAIAEFRPMRQVVASTTTRQRFTSVLLAVFASTATLLAAIGLYGVIAIFVGQRRHELGIRLAVGAQRSDLLRLVMWQGGRMILIGTAAGVLGALALSRTLSGLLFGLSAIEPLSYAIGIGTLAISGLLACYLPARHAMNVDPVLALRAE